MVEPLFIVERKSHYTDDTGRWAYIDRCPHGVDLGAIHLSSHITHGDRWSYITWQFDDLGNGKCRITPSILAKGMHNGEDCHFGPGEFYFMWLEEGELINEEPFLSRYNEKIKSMDG
jgi:hypothetical protein